MVEYSIGIPWPEAVDLKPLVQMIQVFKNTTMSLLLEFVKQTKKESNAG